jgi:hypothetical protein
LSGFSGDDTGATPVRITTKDIINALNDAGNSFSKRARLLVEVPADGGSPAFVVRDGDTDTDVSDSFSTDTSSTISNGRQQYQILTLQFDAGTGTDFLVSGFTTEHIGTVRGKDTGSLSDQVTSLNSSVSGTGDVGGTSAVLKGTVNAGGAKGEMH